MFTLAELEEDPAAILDIKEDIREECAKLGDVTNVVLYDKEPDGVASVRFSTPEAAAACVRVSSPLSLTVFPYFAFLPSSLTQAIFLLLSAPSHQPTVPKRPLLLLHDRRSVHLYRPRTIQKIQREETRCGG